MAMFRVAFVILFMLTVAFGEVDHALRAVMEECPLEEDPALWLLQTGTKMMRGSKLPEDVGSEEKLTSDAAKDQTNADSATDNEDSEEIALEENISAEAPESSSAWALASGGAFTIDSGDAVNVSEPRELSVVREVAYLITTSLHTNDSSAAQSSDQANKVNATNATRAGRATGVLMLFSGDFVVVALPWRLVLGCVVSVCLAAAILLRYAGSGDKHPRLMPGRGSSVTPADRLAQVRLGEHLAALSFANLGDRGS